MLAQVSQSVNRRAFRALHRPVETTVRHPRIGHHSGHCVKIEALMSLRHPKPCATTPTSEVPTSRKLATVIGGSDPRLIQTLVRTRVGEDF